MRTKILITGISSGIGLGLAKKYLADGAVVYGISRRRSEELAAYPHFYFQSADLNSPEEIKAAVGQFSLEGSELDAVILNAGVHGAVGDLKETELAQLLSVMNVNVWANKVLLDALFHVCLHVKQVIALSSQAALTAYRGAGAYCVSKAALNMLMALYAEEKKDTHFSAVAPPLVDTAMQDYLTGLPPDERFESFELLNFAKELGQMLSPQAAAEILVPTFEAALQKPSGSFVEASSVETNSRMTPISG